MKRIPFLAYAGFAILLGASSLTFAYNRATATWKTIKQALSIDSLATAYYKNDRYFPVVQIQQQYPSYPVYFLSNSQDSQETSYLWQMVQSYYLSYPKIITELKYDRDSDTLAKLRAGETSGIVISPFKQPYFAGVAKELHPHAEYYLYIIHPK